MPYEDMGVLVASVLSEPITEERYVYYQEDELPDTYVAELYSDDGTLLSEMRVYSGAGGAGHPARLLLPAAGRTLPARRGGLRERRHRAGVSDGRGAAGGLCCRSHNRRGDQLEGALRRPGGSH